jgi:hypothetical protein
MERKELTLLCEDLDTGFGEIVTRITTSISLCRGLGTYGGQVIPCLLPVLMITLGFSC